MCSNKPFMANVMHKLTIIAVILASELEYHTSRTICHMFILLNGRNSMSSMLVCYYESRLHLKFDSLLGWFDKS